MIIKNDYQKITNFLNDKLIGASFTYFSVWQYSLQICFYVKTSDGLKECWLCAYDSMVLSKGNRVETKDSGFLSVFKGLLGDSIKYVKINESGKINIAIGNWTLSIPFENDDFTEVIWSITPHTADPYTDHPWSVILTDDHEVILRNNTVTT